MNHKDSSGPLPSDDLERDRDQAGQDQTLADELTRDERGGAGDRDEHGASRPNPIAGTMLPPD